IFNTPKHPLAVLRASVYGMTAPWNLAISAALGIWMMAVPDVLGNQSWVADVDHLAGALIAVVSVIAFAEPIRTIRFLIVPLGLLIAGAPFLVSQAAVAGWINDCVIGLAAVVLCIRRGPIKESFGSWDRWIK
ncbi:MAG: vitamin K epoxide reductase, partial [Phycisphaerales bacterium]